MKQTQLSLFSQSASEAQTLYLQKPKDFQWLISGFKEIRAVSDVASPRLILSIFDKYRFERMQLLVGENISVKHYKKDLENKQISQVQRLLPLRQE